MKKLLIAAAVFTVILSACLNYSSTAPESNGKKSAAKLNNLVSDIAYSEATPGTMTFSVPKNGWVFFSLQENNAEATAQILSNTGEKYIKFEKGESMQWLDESQYKIVLNKKANKKLIIRTIPELIYDRSTLTCKAPDKQIFLNSSKEEHGRDGLYLYYWDYLKKDILLNYNAVVGGAPKDSPLIKEWYDCGKKIICPVQVTNNENDADKIFEKWSTGFKFPYSGVIADEFVPPTRIISEKDKELGGYRPGAGFKEKILDIITQLHDKYKGKGSFYAYLGIPTDIETLKNCSPLMDKLSPANDYWVWEAYLWPARENPENYLEKYFIQRMKALRATFPGSEKNCIVCLAPIVTWDNVSEINFKVWLDMQMNIIANNEAFENIAGVSFWSATYMDPEIQRWFSMLMRHYCIEGSKGMLSDKYGYTLKLDHINNPDFRNELQGWEVSPAAEKSIAVKTMKDFTFKKGYFPKCANLLTMQKVDGKNNKISQKITNLKPGQIYSLTYQCGSPEIKDGVKVKYNQQVSVSGAKILQQRVDVTRKFGNDICNNICWNFVSVIFQAETDTAAFSISDENASLPEGYPVIKEMLFDYIKVQPFLNN